jgi:hypothetical protein
MSQLPRTRDPVTEVFEAIAQAKRTAPQGRTHCRVAVRSRTGQLLASFVLGGDAQLQAFAEQARRLGYLMAVNEWDAPGCYEFSFDRRAANEAIDHPRRRRED